MRIFGCDGFALVSVLLFLQIFSLLSLFSLNSAAYEFKGMEHVWVGDKNRLLANQMVDEIEVQLMQALPSCLISTMPSAQLVTQTRKWWVQHGCPEERGGLHFRFVIESLGEDRCAIIPPSREIADYFRLTLVAYPANFNGTKLIFQSTVVRPKFSKAICTDVLRPVKMGEQMRRQLIT